MLKEVLIKRKCDLKERRAEYITEIHQLDKALEEIDTSGVCVEDGLEIRRYLLGIKDKDLSCLDIAERRLSQVNGFLDKLG